MYNQAVQNRFNSDLSFSNIETVSSSNSLIQGLLHFFQDLLSTASDLATIVIFGFFVFSFIKLLVNLKGVGAKAAAEQMSQDTKQSFLWLWTVLSKGLGFLFSPFAWLFKKLKFVLLPALLVFIGFGVAQQVRLVDTVNIKTGQMLINMKDQTTLASGRHVIFPFFNEYILVHTANYTFEIPHVTADSSEPQDVNIHAGITFKLKQDQLFDFYTREGVIPISTVTDRLVTPESIEAIKNVVREYSYKDILSKQTEVKNKALEAINNRLNPLGIEVTNLTLINIIVPREYVRKIAERDLLTDSLEIEEQRLKETQIITQTELELANREKQRQIIEAEGIAEANRITSEQTLTAEILELKKLEIQKNLIEKWDGSMPDSTGDNFSLISQ